MLAEAPDGPLHGVPVAVKDMFPLPWRAPRDGSDTRLLPRRRVGDLPPPARRGRRGRRRHEHALPGRRLDRHLSAYGPVGNPWNPAHGGGGSSGGSASAVGARLVAGSVGADGGGSIRLPAAYCGVTGLKLTWGAVPATATPTATSTRRARPVRRDADDARLLLEALAGARAAAGRRDRLRVGVPRLLGRPRPRGRARLPGRRSTRPAGRPRTSTLEAQEHARIATVLHLTLEGMPECAARATEPARPAQRALAKYELLMPAPRCARGPRARSQLRRSLAEASSASTCSRWPTVPAPAPPIEDPTVQLPPARTPADCANVRQTGLGNLTGVPGITCRSASTRAACRSAFS